MKRVSRLGVADDASATGGSPVRLEVTNLRIELASSGADVVSDVSFRVGAGEMLGLVGESGPGKTTVALALLVHARRGLDITAGEIRLEGENLLDLKPRELRAVRGAKVAYVPQDPAAALDPTLRVGFQLREALRVHPAAAGDGWLGVHARSRPARAAVEHAPLLRGGKPVPRPRATTRLVGIRHPAVR